MDVTDMSVFTGNSFDLIIDKSTIDCLSCGDAANLMVAKMLKECQRVLKVGGVNFTISLGKQADRIVHF